MGRGLLLSPPGCAHWPASRGACGQSWEAFRWHKLLLLLIIVSYKRRQMLEVITRSPSQVCEAVMGPSPVGWPGQQRLRHRGQGVEGHWLEPCFCLVALGLQQQFGDQVFPGLGPGFGWPAGPLGSAQELSRHGGVRGERGQEASPARQSLNGMGKLEGERIPPQLDGKLAENNGKEDQGEHLGLACAASMGTGQLPPPGDGG